jgi:WhiB family transcriptional regulator, redox-sensing transcriptional regulator
VEGRPYLIGTAYPPFTCKGCGRNTIPGKAPLSKGEVRCEKLNESCTQCAAWVRRNPGKTLADRREMRKAPYTVKEPDGGSMDWQRESECQWYPDEPEMWYPLPAGEHPRTSRNVAYAKRVCQRCPVVTECLRWSMANGETGVRGGVYLRAGKIWNGPQRVRKRKRAAEKEKVAA